MYCESSGKPHGHFLSSVLSSITLILTMMRNLLVGLTILFLLACNETSTDKVVAQVGDSFLYWNDLEKMVPEHLREHLTRDQYLAMVKRWIDSEVLHNMAMKAKVHQSPEYKEMLKVHAHKMLVDQYISKVIRDVEEPSEEEVKEFYENNKDDFGREHTLYKISYVEAPTNVMAWKWRANVNKTTYDDEKRVIKRAREYDVQDMDFKPLMDLELCMRSPVKDLKLKRTSLPVKCGKQKIRLIHLYDKLDEGTPKSFEEAKNEVVQKLKKRKIQKQLDSLVNMGKSKLMMITYLENIPDSTEKKAEETLENE